MTQTLHYTDTGKGEATLVFLHYFGGSANSWSKVIAELYQQFRCIAIDLPGFGESPEIQALTVTECAKDVASLIQSLALDQYVFIGHSMGGKIAMLLASFQPLGLISLILVAPSPPTPEPMTEEGRKELAAAFGNRNKLEASLNNITAHPLSDTDREKAIADNFRDSYVAWKWWVEHGSREDISSKMCLIKVPVSVVSGAEDHNISTGFLKNEMTKYFPFAAFVEIADTGHLIPLESPEALADFIKTSIKQNYK